MIGKKKITKKNILTRKISNRSMSETSTNLVRTPDHRERTRRRHPDAGEDNYDGEACEDTGQDLGGSTSKAIVHTGNK